MNREPVNLDDPDLTAYALGEMNISETREFESKLETSPNARAELESMDDIMSLLSKGLKSEWASEMREPNLEVLPSISHAESSKVVPFRFSRSKKALGSVAAAAAAVALFVGTVASLQSVSPEVASTGNSFEEGLLASSFANPQGVHVPRVVIDNKTDIVGNMSLSEAVENLETLAVPVDASYLEANGSVLAGHRNGGHTRGVLIPAGFSSSADRVDSYLPPVPGANSSAVGLIEKRVESARGAVRIPVGNSSNVLVRGFVTLDGADRSKRNDSEEALLGFQPVSMSGNPVRSTDDDLRLMAELQAVQRDILNVVEQMSVSSPERAALLSLLERNREAIEGLKAQFSQ